MKVTITTLAPVRPRHNTVNSVEKRKLAPTFRQATLPAILGSLVLGMSDSGGNMHKSGRMIVLMLFALTMSGCGSNNGTGPGNINGTWFATLTDTSYNFSTTFTQGSGSTLSVTQFTFTSTAPCFASETTTEMGSFSLSGNFNGSVQGTFGMTITGTTRNVLTLTGTVMGNTISGNWTLTGGGCSGNGTFTIHPPMAGG
jgi:hypothetical protein